MARRTRWSLATGAAVFLAAFVAAGPGMTQELASRQEEGAKIQITVDGAVLTATLEDSATARDFVSLLPLTVTLEDYASTEKIADLARRLDTEDAPAGIDPSVGDIAYYIPWGNLAIFYRDFGYSPGLVKLATIESGVEILGRDGRIGATIEVVETE